MKLLFTCIACMVGVSSAAFAQEVIPLYAGAAPGSPEPNYPEKQYFSKLWNTEVVTNVTNPTLTLYRPSRAVTELPL